MKIKINAMQKRNWVWMKFKHSSDVENENAFVLLPMVVWYKGTNDEKWQIFIAWLSWAVLYVTSPGQVKDGWSKYDYNDRKTFPPFPGKYLTCSKDKKTYKVVFWSGLSWLENDTSIGYFSSIEPVPKKPF